MPEREALICEKLPNNLVKCNLCPRMRVIKLGKKDRSITVTPTSAITKAGEIALQECFHSCMLEILQATKPKIQIDVTGRYESGGSSLRVI